MSEERPDGTDPSFRYDKPIFNTRALAGASAQSNTRTLVTGNLGATGTVTFNGVVHGQVVDNDQVTIDRFFPLSRPNSLAGAVFTFSAGLGQVGQNCSSVGCPGGNVVLKFGNQSDHESGYSTLNNGEYSRPFSLTIAVTESLELQTFLSLSASASNGAAAVFTNTARITDITVSDGLGLDTSDGTLAFDGTRYAMLATLAQPVPEPHTALLLLGLATTAGWMKQRQRGA